ncbi:MAG: hypothetical protein QOD83_4609 [Solirubrobacteraceae bacterium]|jgi:hypothetical protein|nr:hypothetical protein [Solirubrobacteraceae bacterium]
MPEEGKDNRFGLVVKIAGGVGTVAAAVAGVMALVPKSTPPPPPPAQINGSISRIKTDHDVTLAAYQSDLPQEPKPCPGFKQPPGAPKRIAMAPRRSGSWVTVATASIGSGALRIAESAVAPAPGERFVDATTNTATTTTDTKPSDTTTTDTTTTDTTPPDRTQTDTTTTDTTTDANPATSTTTDTTTTPGGVSEIPATPAASLGGARTLSSTAAVKLLEGTRTTDEGAAATREATRRIATGTSTVAAELKGNLADYLLGEVVNFKARIIGLVGLCTYVRWTLYDARERPRRAQERQLVNRDALFFTPRAVDDNVQAKVWVGLPRRKGPFFVRLELFKVDGGGLDRGDSKEFG